MNQDDPPQEVVKLSIEFFPAIKPGASPSELSAAQSSGVFLSHMAAAIAQGDYEYAKRTVEDFMGPIADPMKGN